jgi:hypothetical protein
MDMTLHRRAWHGSSISNLDSLVMEDGSFASSLIESCLSVMQHACLLSTVVLYHKTFWEAHGETFQRLVVPRPGFRQDIAAVGEGDVESYCYSFPRR